MPSLHLWELTSGIERRVAHVMSMDADRTDISLIPWFLGGLVMKR